MLNNLPSPRRANASPGAANPRVSAADDLWARHPFDLHSLHLFRLVAETRSFTAAAQRAGLTQSAVTRQIRHIEDRADTVFFERTTRRVELTPAGEFFLSHAERILAEASTSWQRLREQFGDAPRTVRVGVSRTIGLAYLPGFFASHWRLHPEVRTSVLHLPSAALLEELDAGRIDLAMLCPPPRIARPWEVTHRFRDVFTIVAPPGFALPRGPKGGALGPKAIREFLAAQPWLLLAEAGSHTGRQLHAWMRRSAGLVVTPAMETDNFDLIVNLVLLGFGLSIVPRRVLPVYRRQDAIVRVPFPVRFERELVVLRKRSRPLPAHVSRFVDCILFG